MTIVRTIPAGEFKAKCLALLDEVAATGEEIIVTKRGKPVARLVSAAVEDPRKKLAGSILWQAEDLETFTSEEDWEALR
jgi:prevent-host-death family protein